MRKIKVGDLTATTLDYAVAKALGASFTTPGGKSRTTYAFLGGVCLGGFITRYDNTIYHPNPFYAPSEVWHVGGRIIEAQRISIKCFRDGHWHAYGYDEERTGGGPTPLVAAMRAFVAITLGVEVEIPEELCEPQSK